MRATALSMTSSSIAVFALLTSSYSGGVGSMCQSLSFLPCSHVGARHFHRLAPNRVARRQDGLLGETTQRQSRGGLRVAPLVPDAAPGPFPDFVFYINS